MFPELTHMYAAGRRAATQAMSSFWPATAGALRRAQEQHAAGLVVRPKVTYFLLAGMRAAPQATSGCPASGRHSQGPAESAEVVSRPISKERLAHTDQRCAQGGGRLHRLRQAVQLWASHSWRAAESAGFAARPARGWPCARPAQQPWRPRCSRQASPVPNMGSATGHTAHELLTLSEGVQQLQQRFVCRAQGPFSGWCFTASHWLLLDLQLLSAQCSRGLQAVHRQGCAGLPD